MSRFLRFVVEQALAGRGDEMKESLVGIEVFDRAPGYDPRIDPIVRVEARRLRRKLQEYYTSAGAADLVRIELPKGTYVPLFSFTDEQAVAAPEPAAKPRILVLPLANLDDSGETNYFSDGLTQELIHALTRLPGLQVVAWNTAARLRGMTGSEPIRQVEATAMVEGSVRRAGGRVRISVQLVDAASSLYLWSGAYERALDDLFAIQREIARSIATTLRVQLTTRESAKRYKADAYDLYLRGRYEWFRRTPEALRQSIPLFEGSIRADETCAPAWAGLADAYSLLADYGLNATAEVMPKAQHAAHRALKLDPSLADAHVSLAFILGLHCWQWDEAEFHYRKALELNPGYVTAHHWYGLDHLALLGRIHEAIHHMEIAIQLDPLEPIIAEGRAYVALLDHRYEECAKHYLRLTQDHPHFPNAWTGLGRVYFCLKRYDEAIEMLERGHALSGERPALIGALSQTHAAAGNVAEARRLLASLHEMSARRHVPATCFAIAHLGLGEPELALDFLDRGCAAREVTLASVKVHPIYDPLRGHPRFESLLKRMNF